MKVGCIYSLIDPGTTLVRYIGQTIVTPNNRYSQHIYQWKRSTDKITHVNSWIKSLASNNLKPIIEIIEDNIDQSLLDSKEINYIKLFKSAGADLCNHSTGGAPNKGCKMSKESIQKRLESCKASELWKEKNIRHSTILKDKHKENPSLFGYGKLSSERRKEIGRLIQVNNPRRKSIKIENSITNEILEFSTIKNAIDYFKCNNGTFRDFIYNKRKSNIFKNYTVLEFDKKSTTKKKK